MTVGQIPVVKFENKDPKVWAVLAARLFHACMDIIVKGLKQGS